MPLNEEVIFQEVMTAIDAGEKGKAKDLLTRLLKVNTNNPQYWVWMSAVVETPKERTYCLKEVLRLEPENKTAKQGLILLGAAPPDESLGVPFSLQKRDWASTQIRQFSTLDQIVMSGTWRPIAAGIAVVVVLGFVLILSLAIRSGKAPRVAGWINYSTSTPSLTPTMVTPTPLERLKYSTAMGKTPLSGFLPATYTPTPLFLTTLHPKYESYRSAMFAYQKGNWQGVIDNMQRLATDEPKSLDVYYYWGEAYRFLKDYPSAIQIYNQALELDAKFAPALLGRARAYLADDNSKNDEAARTDLEAAYSYQPETIEIAIQLAALDISGKRVSEAVEILTGLPDSPLRSFYLAQAYLAQGNPDQALQYAILANDQDITLLPAYALMGQIYLAKNKPSDALEPLLIYTAYVLDDVDAWISLGSAFALNQQMPEALKALDQAINLKKDDPEVYLARGEIYLNMEKGALAKADFTFVLGLEPKSFTANLGLGRALMLQGVYNTATYYFNLAEGFIVSPTDRANLYYWRALSLEGMGESVAANRNWSALLDLPSSVVPGAWIGQARQHLNRLQNTLTFTLIPTLLTPTGTLPTSSPTLTGTQPTVSVSLTSSTTNLAKTPGEKTPTHTRFPTGTSRPTQTRFPSSTSTASKTPPPSATLTPTPSRTTAIP